MLRSLGERRAELSILLCDDRTIASLNREYRGKKGPTDVLSFPMRDSEGGTLQPNILGDVVISIDTARRQAKARDRPIVAEVTFLLAHGLLHLLGFDHQTDSEEKEMTAKTHALVASVKSARGRRRARSQR